MARWGASDKTLPVLTDPPKSILLRTTRGLLDGATRAQLCDRMLECPLADTHALRVGALLRRDAAGTSPAT